MPTNEQVQRIMDMSDEEILAEVKARGEDPEVVAARTRAVIDRAIKMSAEPASTVME